MMHMERLKHPSLGQNIELVSDFDVVLDLKDGTRRELWYRTVPYRTSIRKGRQAPR